MAAPSVAAPRWPYPRTLAHRGGGTLAPENTLPAFDAGHAHGYRAAEFDAVLAADGIPVLLHDETLDRTTNGRGPVAVRTAGELARLDAGAWFDARYAGTPVPTLGQALQHCYRLGIWLNVEIKPVPGHEARTGDVVARTVADFYASRPEEEKTKESWRWPVLSSFSPSALGAARRAAPSLPRGLLFGRVPANWLAAMQSLDARTLHCDHRTLTAELAGQIGAAGYGLLCYTVNDPARWSTLRSWGVDAICTDRIDLIAPDSPGTPPRTG
jgi:glycerophosphoryl diester phosphodiesterase